MAQYLKTRWQGDRDSAIRQDRLSCDYDVYLPDALNDRIFQIDGTVAAEVSDAESDIRALNATSGVLTNTEALARLLLRAESVASSHIEGLQVGGRRLLQSEMEHELGISSHDVTANEVLGNISAMEWSIQTVSEGGEITPSVVKEAHRRLLAGTRIESEGGKLRTVQNWIGGNSLNPCSADFVPPPPEQVESLLEDLCAFCREDRLPALVQAALAHAQFETIHPFVDGNGRTGRALIHLVLRVRGLAPRVLAPISLILATRSKDYVDGLTKTRYVGDPTSESAHGGVNYWLDIFASCTRRAVREALDFETKVETIRSRWRASLEVRANSALDLLISALPGSPILTVKTASAMIGRSFQATNVAVARLLDAGILTQANWGRRNRAFEATEIIDAFADLERQLASPEGNTRHSPPDRKVPSRRPATKNRDLPSLER